MPVRVKICGITSFEDARAAVDAGADALGFIFFKGSPRYVELKIAADIIHKLPPFATTVGVFVDETAENIARICRDAGLAAVQLHGKEEPSFCSEIQAKTIKAFRVKDQSSLSELPKYHVSAFLLDSYVPGQMGGTGAKFNWDLAVQAKTLGTPIILAGGLTVENIADAVAKVRPFGVDVSTGVEISPGRKDHAKVREFIARAKAA
jgi:phosphoribosylanthranilate isomerase